MSKTDALFHVGHRERLKDKFLDGKLSDYEKLELLLTYAIPRRDVRVLARTLLARFESIYNILHAPISELMSVSGIGRSAAILIKLFHDLNNISHMQMAKSGTYLSDEMYRNNYCRDLVSDCRVEEMHVLYLGAESKLISDEVHSRGTVDESLVYPREILQRAMALNATGVILVHNHPMSNNSFSSADIQATADLNSLLRLVRVRLVDHLLVTSGGIVHSYWAQPWANKSSFFEK